MFWYDHDPGGWGWFAMSIGMVHEDEYHRRLTVLRGRADDGPRLSKT